MRAPHFSDTINSMMKPIASDIGTHIDNDGLADYHAFIDDTKELELYLELINWSADKWFDSLGPSWNDYEAKLRIALLKRREKKTGAIPNPELQFAYSAHFPHWWPEI